MTAGIWQRFQLLPLDLATFPIQAVESDRTRQQADGFLDKPAADKGMESSASHDSVWQRFQNKRP